MALSAQSTLAHGPLVGVDHDAYGLALVRRAGGLDPRSGGGEWLGEQRVLLAHGFVGDHGDFALARCSDQGDHAMTLEKPQDALARSGIGP